jgi:hypothetical protein
MKAGVSARQREATARGLGVRKRRNCSTRAENRRSSRRRWARLERVLCTSRQRVSCLGAGAMTHVDGRGGGRGAVQAASLIAAGGARGAWPRRKVSMITRGAPQQGHGRALAVGRTGWSGLAWVRSGTAMSGESGTASSARARVRCATRVALAKRP